jgi:hypothetical protein
LLGKSVWTRRSAVSGGSQKAFEWQSPGSGDHMVSSISGVQVRERRRRCNGSPRHEVPPKKERDDQIQQSPLHRQQCRFDLALDQPWERLPREQRQTKAPSRHETASSALLSISCVRHHARRRWQCSQGRVRRHLLEEDRYWPDASGRSGGPSQRRMMLCLLVADLMEIRVANLTSCSSRLDGRVFNVHSAPRKDAYPRRRNYLRHRGLAGRPLRPRLIVGRHSNEGPPRSHLATC